MDIECPFVKKLQRWSLLCDTFVYMDHKDYCADYLLSEKCVRVKFLQEYAKEGTPYRILICKVRKKDSAIFIEALMDLPKRMLLLGHDDYDAECKKYHEFLESYKQERRGN